MRKILYMLCGIMVTLLICIGNVQIAEAMEWNWDGSRFDWNWRKHHPYAGPTFEHFGRVLQGNKGWTIRCPGGYEIWVPDNGQLLRQQDLRRMCQEVQNQRGPR